MRFCDAFNIPIITFVDVPGFLPGLLYVSKDENKQFKSPGNYNHVKTNSLNQ